MLFFSLRRLSLWFRLWSCSTLLEVGGHSTQRFIISPGGCLHTLSSRSHRSRSVRASHGPDGCTHGRVSPQSHVCQDAAGIGKLRLLQRSRHRCGHDANSEHLCGAAQSEESSRRHLFTFSLFLPRSLKQVLYMHASVRCVMCDVIGTWAQKVCRGWGRSSHHAECLWGLHKGNAFIKMSSTFFLSSFFNQCNTL